MLDNKLVGCMDSLSKNLEQRMYFLKKLLSFNVDSRMLFMFYRAFTESIKTLCVICWYGNASETQMRSLGKVVTTASKLEQN